MSISLLLVEDYADIAEFVTEGLSGVGMSVVCTDSAANAKALFANGEGFDLLLVDERLPDGNGAELVAWAKAQASVPAILIGDGHKSSRAPAANVELKKPFELEELLRAIYWCVGKEATG